MRGSVGGKRAHCLMPVPSRLWGRRTCGSCTHATLQRGLTGTSGSALLRRRRQLPAQLQTPTAATPTPRGPRTARAMRPSPSATPCSCSGAGTAWVGSTTSLSSTRVRAATAAWTALRVAMTSLSFVQKRGAGCGSRPPASRTSRARLTRSAASAAASSCSAATTGRRWARMGDTLLSSVACVPDVGRPFTPLPGPA